jgi:hypothetical protein
MSTALTEQRLERRQRRRKTRSMTREVGWCKGGCNSGIGGGEREEEVTVRGFVGEEWRRVERECTAQLHMGSREGERKVGPGNGCGTKLDPLSPILFKRSCCG